MADLELTDCNECHDCPRCGEADALTVAWRGTEYYRGYVTVVDGKVTAITAGKQDDQDSDGISLYCWKCRWRVNSEDVDFEIEFD